MAASAGWTRQVIRDRWRGLSPLNVNPIRKVKASANADGGPAEWATIRLQGRFANRTEGR